MARSEEQKMTIAVIAGFLLFLAWREYCHDKERKDLYNRLMSRDITEYMTTQDNKPPKQRNFVKKGLKDSIDMLTGKAGE
jgi:hypothetical protein